MEGQLGDYLVDNSIEASGVHLQAGLRFKLLTFDTCKSSIHNGRKCV